MKRRHSAITLAAVAAIGSLVVSVATVTPAQADNYPIEYYVTASAKLSAQSIRVKKKVTGTTSVVFTRLFLGIPMPSTGFYTSSFPQAVKRPTLTAVNAALNSRKYAHRYNTYLKKTQWEVNGKQDFAGKLAVSISGTAVGAKKGTGYFYGGTYTCGTGCINAQAIKKLTVRN